MTTPGTAFRVWGIALRAEAGELNESPGALEIAAGRAWKEQDWIGRFVPAAIDLENLNATLSGATGSEEWTSVEVDLRFVKPDWSEGASGQARLGTLEIRTNAHHSGAIEVPIFAELPASPEEPEIGEDLGHAESEQGAEHAGCLELAPAEVLNFSICKVGKQCHLPVEIRNCGAGKLSVTSVEFEDPAPSVFTLDFTKMPGFGDGRRPSADDPIIVPDGGSAKIFVRYSPVADFKTDRDGKDVYDRGRLVFGVDGALGTGSIGLLSEGLKRSRPGPSSQPTSAPECRMFATQ